MASADSSSPKARFDRAFRDFIGAHIRGMRSLEVRDYGGLQKAIAEECIAVEKVAEAINEAVGSLPPESRLATPEVRQGSDPAIRAEHRRLLEQMKALDNEHRDLETRPDDLDAHRQHRARLQAHIAELRVHLSRVQEGRHAGEL